MSEPRDNVGVHATHCCIDHGCSYGENANCPVASGSVKQEHPCEICVLLIEELSDATAEMPIDLWLAFGDDVYEIYEMQVGSTRANVHITRITGSVTFSRDVPIPLETLNWLTARARLCVMSHRFNN